MILFNNNFSSPITKTILSEYFTTVTNPTNLNVMGCITDNTGTMSYASGSTLVGRLMTNVQVAAPKENINTYIRNSASTNPKNFQIVTEKFLKVLDKVYTKIWNEAFTETGIYSPNALASIFSGFSSNDYGWKATNQFDGVLQYWYPTIYTMRFYNFVSRCITAGILTEDDRLTSEDQIFIAQPQGTISTNIDTVNNIITFSSNSVIDISDFNTQEGSYLYGKKLYLLMTPFIANASTIKLNINYNHTQLEPVSSSQFWGGYNEHLNFYSPWGFFKPKSSDSKFGASLPLATHLFWRIGTPEDKELALLEGTEVPEIIFDHLDRVSHIDTFQLKVKYGPIQFA